MADEKYTSEYGEALSSPQPSSETSNYSPVLPPPSLPPAPSEPPLYSSSYGSTVYPSEPDKGKGQRNQSSVYNSSYPPGRPVYQTPPTNTYAIVAFVCGISSLFIGLTAVFAVIFGHIAVRRINQTGEQGKGLAIAGLVIGYVSITFGLLFILFYIFIFGMIIASGSYTY